MMVGAALVPGAPLLVFLVGVARDPALMSEHGIGNRATAGYLTIAALLAACVVAMGVLLAF